MTDNGRYIPSQDDVAFCIQVEASTAAGRFAIGDLINLRSEQAGASFREVAYALADEAGASGETYRDSATVARAVEADWREEFPLTFHQWRACVPGGAYDMAVWACEEGVSPSGRPASARRIREHIASIQGKLIRVQDYRIRRLGRALEVIAGDDRLDAGLVRMAGRLLAVLERRWSYGE